MPSVLGKFLILFGLMSIVLGLLLVFSGKIPFLGKLPGDITIKREHVQIFVPLASSAVLSILLSALLWLISHFQK